MSTLHHQPPDNQLLAALPPDIAECVFERVELVELAAGTVLYDAGSALRHVHFPVTAVVSLVSPMLDGAAVEVAVVGREGVAGVCAFMGGAKALSSALVQRRGLAWRMSARDIADLASSSELLMQHLLRYTQALFTQMAQISACHRHHALASKLCRWLLQHLDRQAGDEMHTTHERIATMLGVRREGVTGAALQLQREGLLEYRRGYVRVLDRAGLQAQSCECYDVVRRAYAQLPVASSSGPSAPGPSSPLHGRSAHSALQ